MAAYSLNTRVGKLRRDQQRQAGYVRNPEWYELRVAPTCPPSKQIQMRGGRTFLSANTGWVIWDDYEYRAYTVPDLTADLSDVDSVFASVSFSTANYFRFFILELRMPAVLEEPAVGDWSFYLHGIDAEYATAGDAEQSINSNAFQTSGIWEHGADGSAYPLCGVVLKNDGNTGVAGAFLPIDVINRGRSYIWPRDLRARQSFYD